MQVILLEKIKNLGALGDSVKVKPGYGRNYLIPQKKAVFATAKNIEMFESRRAELEQKAAQTLAHAQQRAATLQDVSLSIAVQASEEGKLFGSIGVSEIIKAFVAQSITVDKHEIILPEGSFDAVGLYTITVQVHSDVVVTVPVEIVAAK